MSSSSDVAAAASSNKKTEWPETVGLTIKEAKKVILKDKPDAKIDVLRVGAATTKDINPDRVRVFVNTVAQIPRIG